MSKVKPFLPNPKAGILPEWKFKFPEGFVLVYSTVKEHSWFQIPPKGLVIVRDTLHTGDFSIKGFENSICVERKAIGDLLNCLGGDRVRFKEQVRRLSKFERKWIFVEGSEDEILCFPTISKMFPEAIRQSIISIELRYNVPFYYAKTRKDAERHCLDLFIKFFHLKREGKFREVPGYIYAE